MLDRLLATVRLPNFLISAGIAILNCQRLRAEGCPSAEARQERLQALCEQLRHSPIAVETDAANRQHYELPAQFFQWVLGPYLKYSSAYWPSHQKGLKEAELKEAEEQMLSLTCERAALQDGQNILELGCGWGSLTLFMAARYPKSLITALSNSASQRDFIVSKAASQGLHNVKVITRDMNDFHSRQRYHRIVSIEMLEHLRNYSLLFERIHSWLLPGGKLFVHIFTHREFAYIFESEGSSNWLGRHFFSGGIMPSRHLLLYFSHPLRLEHIWQVDGTHYEKTARAWLKNLEQHRYEILRLFQEAYGEGQERRWLNYWRIFFLAVAELFGTRRGQEWGVSHYLFSRPQHTPTPDTAHANPPERPKQIEMS